MITFNSLAACSSGKDLYGDHNVVDMFALVLTGDSLWSPGDLIQRRSVDGIWGKWTHLSQNFSTAESIAACALSPDRIDIFATVANGKCV